ncbi:uncharacterized protein FIESC28_07405 [Fusarium coffeatum]|uniref:Uncharacterized protein n=1 Tax=Fusarium coffeatum TaxID=231269 RepID=A0A366RG54_9HYPO|nr:uncharacterized protein FIESC28_07405 [Fusarium coffeatum]RBR15225.1 hypothetical protein FIESC28_07405 [Fusarium coffeatum]
MSEPTIIQMDYLRGLLRRSKIDEDQSNFIYGQIEAACREIEQKRDDTNRLKEQTEILTRDLEREKASCTSQQNVLRNRLRHLDSFLVKQKALPGRLDSIVESVSQSRHDVISEIGKNTSTLAEIDNRSKSDIDQSTSSINGRLDTLAGVVSKTKEDVIAFVGDGTSSTAHGLEKLVQRVSEVQSDQQTFRQSIKTDTDDIIGKLDGVAEAGEQSSARLDALKACSTSISEALRKSEIQQNDMSQAFQSRLDLNLAKADFHTRIESFEGHVQSQIGVLNDKTQGQLGKLGQDVRDQIDSLDDRLQAGFRAVNDLPTRLGALNEQAKTQIGSLAELEKSIGALPSKSDVLSEIARQLAPRTEQDELTGRCERFEEEVARLTLDNDAYQRQIVDIQTGNQAELMRVQEDLRTALRKEQELTDRVGRRDDTIEWWQRQAVEVEEHYSQCGPRFDRCEEQLWMCQADLQEAQARLEHMVPVERFQEAVSKANGLQQRVTDLEASLEDMREHNAAQSKTLADTVSETERERQRVARAESYVTQLNGRVSEAKTELSQFRALSDQNRSLQNDLIRSLESQRATLEEQLVDKRDLVVLKAQKVDLLQSKLDDVQGQLQQALLESSGLQEALTAADAKIESLGRKLESEATCDLALQLEQATSRISTLENQLEAGVVVPKGQLGGLSAMYIQLAEQVRDIPTATEDCETFELSIVATEIAPLLVDTQLGVY